MKKVFIAMTVTLASLFALSASAATLVTSEEVQSRNLQAMNKTITISGRDGDQTHLRQELSEKADAEGATHYRIIEDRQDDTWHIIAELYK